jgi:hypothetical protein
MIALTDTTHSLGIILEVSPGIHYNISYVDTTATVHTPGSVQGLISTGVTIQTLLAAPAAGVTRGIKLITIVNIAAANSQCTIYKIVSGTNYLLFRCTLFEYDTLVFTPEQGFRLFDNTGKEKFGWQNTTPAWSQIVTLRKVGTAPDAIGYEYSFGKDFGVPGPWPPGTPGLGGRNCIGTSLSTDPGCLTLPSMTGLGITRRRFLERWDLVSNVANQYYLYDILKIYTGWVVTQTTTQFTGSGALIPSRDANGLQNGDGLLVGLLVTTATTNAGVISNTTIGFADQAGSPVTATMQAAVGFQLPATAVAGTIVWFSMPAGSNGVRYIQNVTLGTSYGAGAVAVFIARQLAQTSVVANVPQTIIWDNPGIPIYNQSCILAGSIAAATTVPYINSSLYFCDRF